tara:strand:+ start:123271 stop:123540 length:270 start_codon:yes stop_codon:yes gene_type:complete
MDYDYKQLHFNEELGREPWVVKGYKHDGYPSNSVCAGMTRIDFLESYESEKDAVDAHPELKVNEDITYGSSFFDEPLKDVSHISNEPII